MKSLTLLDKEPKKGQAADGPRGEARSSTRPRGYYN
jgi:hypothetical protein